MKVADVELSFPLRPIAGLDAYGSLQALVRLHGAPLGHVIVPVTDGGCSAEALGAAILARHGGAIVRHLERDALTAPLRPASPSPAELFGIPHPGPAGAMPPVTVAVCTRDRTADLALCLAALRRVEYPELDVVVVDNAPTGDATERLVRTTFPEMRYFREPRPGLDWARNRAICEARGEVIAYTDDDLVVDPGWVHALAAIFADNPEAMAVTGLVVPYELETEAQFLFEQYGGFGRGFERRWALVSLASGQRAAAKCGNTAVFGTGANMAFRRSLFAQIGAFDPALDVGTVTHGGGDLEMFFRVLKEGHVLVYEPSAVGRHRHRRTHAELHAQLTDWGIGMYSYIVRSMSAYPEERLAFARRIVWSMGVRFLGRLLLSFFHRRFPRRLILSELRGAVAGFRRYPEAQRAAAAIATAFGVVVPIAQSAAGRRPAPAEQRKASVERVVELSDPPRGLNDLTGASTVRVSVTRDGRPLGSFVIANEGKPIGATRLRDMVATRLGDKLFGPQRAESQAHVAARLTANFAEPARPAPSSRRSPQEKEGQ